VEAEAAGGMSKVGICLKSLEGLDDVIHSFTRLDDIRRPHDIQSFEVIVSA
jgi:hypothetical protein